MKQIRSEKHPNIEAFYVEVRRTDGEAVCSHDRAFSVRPRLSAAARLLARRFSLAPEGGAEPTSLPSESLKKHSTSLPSAQLRVAPRARDER